MNDSKTPGKLSAKQRALLAFMASYGQPVVGFNPLIAAQSTWQSLENRGLIAGGAPHHYGPRRHYELTDAGIKAFLEQ